MRSQIYRFLFAIRLIRLLYYYFREMWKIEIYENCKKISQFEYLRPIIVVLIIIITLVMWYLCSIAYEQHVWEPTKDSCIEYFTKNSR